MIKNMSGYLFLGLRLILEGLFPIFTYFALRSMPTMWLVANSIGIALICGGIIFFKQRLYNQYKQKAILVPTLFSALFLGVGGVLYFFGVKYSSPSTASIFLLFQSFFAFIIFNLFGKEEYHSKQIIGAILMVIGGIIVLYNGDSFMNLGAVIMIIACIFSTFGNYYTKQASLKGANTFFLLVNRNILMVFVTSILAYLFVGPLDIEILKQNIIWIFLIGFLVLFLSKALWIVALSKLNGFVAITSLSIIPLLVMCFSFFIFKEVPTYREMFGFLPIFIGTLLLVQKKCNSKTGI